MSPLPGLIQALLDPWRYDHPVGPLTLIETHISWVILTGPYAYKIKKPVNLGFLDFSTLAQRRFYCHEELRLNQRLAPELYLAVIPITGSPQQPVLNGPGTPFEYAVKMVQFPQEHQLDRVLQRGALTAAHIDALAEGVAMFHQHAARAPLSSDYGQAEIIWHYVAENFPPIEAALEDAAWLPRLAALRQWSQHQHARLAASFAQRRSAGLIRECHGDMHLKNITLLGPRPVAFDCIEFNDQLRWIDVMSEVAFLTMDLYDHGRPALAHRFLNAYLQASGDYAGLQVLRYYQVYRALVRAKVAGIELGQSAQPEQRAAAWRRCVDYLQLAEACTKLPPTPLIITHGLSGSGKTWHSQVVVETSGAIRIRSDVERKRLHGLTPEARSRSEVGAGLYSAQATTDTYARLRALARDIILAGYPVIVDATFLKKQQRQDFKQLAQELAVPFVIFNFQAPQEILRGRIIQRAQGGRDASEADLAVLNAQLQACEALTEDEAPHILTIDTSLSVPAS